MRVLHSQNGVERRTYESIPIFRKYRIPQIEIYSSDPPLHENSTLIFWLRLQNYSIYTRRPGDVQKFEALDEATLQREAFHFSCQCLETSSPSPGHSYLLLLYQRTWPCWSSLLILTTLELILLLIHYLINVGVCLL